MDMRELEYFLAVVDSGGFCSAFSPAVAARTFLRPEDLADDGRLAAVPVGSGRPMRWSTTARTASPYRRPDPRGLGRRGP